MTHSAAPASATAQHDAARAALGTSVEMPAARDRLLLARAAVIENRPAAAIGYLAGLEDEPALALRATALDMAQDHAGALRAYEATGDREKMVQMAWRGGLWSEAAALDPGASDPFGRLKRFTGFARVQLENRISALYVQKGEKGGAVCIDASLDQYILNPITHIRGGDQGFLVNPVIGAGIEIREKEPRAEPENQDQNAAPDPGPAEPDDAPVFSHTAFVAGLSCPSG